MAKEATVAKTLPSPAGRQRGCYTFARMSFFICLILASSRL